MKNIESAYATISYEAPVVSMVFKPGVILGFPEMRELIAHAEEISGHQPYVVLCDLRKGVQITREGKRTVADKNNVPLKRGTALVVHQSELEKSAELFDDIKTPDFPFRAFSNVNKAKDWLLKLPLGQWMILFNTFLLEICI